MHQDENVAAGSSAGRRLDAPAAVPASPAQYGRHPLGSSVDAVETVAQTGGQRTGIPNYQGNT